MCFKICYALGMKHLRRFMRDFYFCAPLKERISHSHLPALQYLAPPGTGSHPTPTRPPPASTSPRQLRLSGVSVAVLSLTKTCVGQFWSLVRFWQTAVWALLFLTNKLQIVMFLLGEGKTSNQNRIEMIQMRPIVEQIAGVR